MEKKTDGFRSKWGFILASIGTAVGMGNIWRFPIMVSKYGGLTFLIPYLLFVILITATGVMEEFAIGRAAASGPVGAFGNVFQVHGKREKVGRGIGILPIIGSLGLGIGYACVVAWILKYFIMALTGSMEAMGQNMELIGETFTKAASANGSTFWIIAVLALCVVIMSLGISKGIEVVNKVLMPTLFAMFLVLCVYIATLNGSAAGYQYILTFDAAGLANPQVWIYSFGQAFFSLSVAGNSSIIYGSYLKKDVSIPFSAVQVAVFDTLAAMLAAFTILPAMAYGGAEMSTGGPGLMFIYMVNIFNLMPGGRIVSIIFFLAVLFAGITSLIGIFEVPIALVQEKIKLKRPLCVLLVFAVCGVVSVLIQPIVSEWMDVASIYLCPLGALLAGIVFFWVGKKKFADEQVSLGSKKPIGGWFYPLGKYAFCTLALLALVFGAIFGGIG